MRQRVGDAVFPDQPGVYVVYDDGDTRPLYVGVAANQTLSERWRRQHLRDRAGGSALRRSLGVHLSLVEIKLRTQESRYYPREVEAAISSFLNGCQVELFPVTTSEEADDLEVTLRKKLKPLLNISTARRRRSDARPSVAVSSSLVIYCADIGSVPNGRFGWARSTPEAEEVERHRGGTEIAELVDSLVADLQADRPVALGFECPLYLPVPDEPLWLGRARQGEANRSWSAGAGAGALATGAVQVAWILAELRRQAQDTESWLDWEAFTQSGRGLFLWEAFVTDRAKAATHVDDATVAVAAFRDALPDISAANAVRTEARPFSLLGASLLWAGWSHDLELLHTPCIVVKAAARTTAQAPDAASIDGPADPSERPRAHRDAREVQRKQTLLEGPHIAPLTALVQQFRDEHGPDSVPWFDPTEAGVHARILLLFENPGRRADALHGSGFISADNDDRSAENMWRIFREAGIDRSRDVVNWNIVPWYLGDAQKIGSVRTSDIDEARPALARLLALLPELRVVILCGRKAQQGWDRARLGVNVLVLRVPHPSGRWLNAHPEDREKIVAALIEARRRAFEPG
jgi:hypothetical protein